MPQPNTSRVQKAPGAPSAEHEWVCRACRLLLEPELGAPFADLTRAPLDFDAACTIATRERVVPLIYHALGGAGLASLLPPAIMERMELEYWHRVSQEVLYAREAAAICRAIASAAAPPLVLKGIALAESIYPTPGLRLLSDLDFLLEPQHVPAACDALLAMGYEPEAPQGPKREETKTGFVRRDRENTGLGLVTAEVHSDVMRGMLDNRIARRMDAAELLERAGPWELLGAPARRLESTDCLLFLAAHVSLQHAFSDLLWLMDLALLMRRRADSLDWDALIARADRMGLRGATYFPLWCCRELLGIGPPEEVFRALRPSRLRCRFAAQLGDAATAWDWNRWPGQKRAVIRRLLTLDTMGDRAAYAWEIVRRGGLRKWRQMPEH